MALKDGDRVKVPQKLVDDLRGETPQRIQRLIDIGLYCRFRQTSQQHKSGELIWACFRCGKKNIGCKGGVSCLSLCKKPTQAAIELYYKKTPEGAVPLPKPPLVEQPVDFPSYAEQALNFAKSTGQHAMSGFQYRSQEEILRILTEHCQPCEFYKKGRCMKCGCPVTSGRRWMNKLARATEKCPVGKW